VEGRAETCENRGSHGPGRAARRRAHAVGAPASAALDPSDAPARRCHRFRLHLQRRRLAPPDLSRLLFWENGLVPAIGILDDPAIRAGLLYQSRVVAVDGVATPDRDAVERVVAATPAGTVHRYALEKDGRRYEIALPATPLSGVAFALTLGNYLVNALVLLALGIVVLFLEPESRSARSFFVFCTNYGLYLATSIDLVGPSWFQTLYFFLLAVAPVTALQLVIEFPARPRASLVCGRVAAALCLGRGPRGGARTRVPPLVRSAAGIGPCDAPAWGAAFLGALGLALVAYRRPSSAAARERMRLFLLGLVGGSLVPALILLTVYWAGNTVFPLNYLTLTFAVFPAAIAYAIARHDLFGVDRIIRQTVGYAVVTAIVAIVYTALLALVDYAVLPDLEVAPAVHVLVTMVLVIVFNPLRGRIQALVDTLYFRAPYDYRTTVTAASQALTSILDVDELVARLGRIVTEQMQVERMEVWLASEDAETVHCVGARDLVLRRDAALVRHLAAHPAGPVHVALGRMGGRVAVEALADMVAIGAVLAVPLALEQRLVGFLALGRSARAASIRPRTSTCYGPSPIRRRSRCRMPEPIGCSPRPTASSAPPATSSSRPSAWPRSASSRRRSRTAFGTPWRASRAPPSSPSATPRQPTRCGRASSTSSARPMRSSRASASCSTSRARSRRTSRPAT
jgi:hypothetical protein